jgi:hypothetical protein
MSSHFEIKLVTTPEYHLWTDALHARKLAEDTKDEWNQGTYVRFAVIFAWIALEQSCKDALDDDNIGFSYYRDMNSAINSKQLTPIDWQNGIWKDVEDLKNLKNQYTHSNSNQNDLWADINKAEKAIKVAREAIKDVYSRVGKPVPTWVDDDN